VAERPKKTPRKRQSDIERCAELLKDEKTLAEVGKRVVQRQLVSIASRRLRLSPIAWEDAWVDNGGWGTDVWTNAWVDDSWEDKLGYQQRTEWPVREETLSEIAEVAFEPEELEVLKEMEIIE
jgi:hypothetical protein